MRAGDLLNTSTPAAHVDEIIDLGFHAMESALRTMFETCDRGSCYSVVMASNMIAAQLLAERLEFLITRFHETALATPGVDVADVDIRVGDPPQAKRCPH